MLICGRNECQTTAGCANRGPRGQLCYFLERGAYKDLPSWLHKVGTLSDFSDDEIAQEYHWRMMQKLGDPRVAVSFTSRS
jgi:hypothetical protein